MFDAQVYVARRQKLREKLGTGLLLFIGNNDSPMNYPANAYKFRQDSSFLYFFGLDLQNLVGLMDLDEGKDYIYGNDVEIDDIIWMGPQPSIAALAAKAGVENTSSLCRLPGVINGALSQGRHIHFLPPYRAETKLQLSKLLGIQPERTRDYASIALIRAVVSLRAIKEAVEIIELEKAAAIGYEMHTTAMRMAADGIFEREIAGRIEGIALSHGGQVSFPVILSRRGETLHNHDHSNLLRKGDLLLVDAGAENPLHYCSDFTRTFPVGGVFSQKQKEIYEIVLAANNKATSLVRPGVTYKSIHLEAARTIANGLKQLGLMKGDVDEAVQQGAHALFFPHGLGHMMGLDVHDMEDLGENHVGYDEETRRSSQFGLAYLRMGKRLETGHVMTNEPGIYFIPALIDKWKKEGQHLAFIDYEKVNLYRDFGGIRLEDDLLVTDSGCRLLGQRIPITVDEIREITGA